jgi:hypothetical protein
MEQQDRRFEAGVARPEVGRRIESRDKRAVGLEHQPSRSVKDRALEQPDIVRQSMA